MALGLGFFNIVLYCQGSLWGFTARQLQVIIFLKTGGAGAASFFIFTHYLTIFILSINI